MAWGQPGLSVLLRELIRPDADRIAARLRR
jgi:hypothetical protein